MSKVPAGLKQQPPFQAWSIQIAIKLRVEGHQKGLGSRNFHGEWFRGFLLDGFFPTFWRILSKGRQWRKKVDFFFSGLTKCGEVLTSNQKHDINSKASRRVTSQNGRKFKKIPKVDLDFKRDKSDSRCFQSMYYKYVVQRLMKRDTHDTGSLPLGQSEQHLRRCVLDPGINGNPSPSKLYPKRETLRRES